MSHRARCCREFLLWLRLIALLFSVWHTFHSLEASNAHSAAHKHAACCQMGFWLIKNESSRTSDSSLCAPAAPPKHPSFDFLSFTYESHFLISSFLFSFWTFFFYFMFCKCWFSSSACIRKMRPDERHTVYIMNDICRTKIINPYNFNDVLDSQARSSSSNQADLDSVSFSCAFFPLSQLWRSFFFRECDICHLRCPARPCCRREKSSSS